LGVRIPSRIKRAAKIVFSPLPAAGASEEDSLRESLLQRIQASPASGTAHQTLGDYYFSHEYFIRAIAQYRTALAFDKTPAAMRSLAEAYRAGGYPALAAETAAALSAPQSLASNASTAPQDDEIGLQSLDASVYQRIRATAIRIKELYGGKPVRVLDIGGGEGALSLFLPAAEYVLAEPATNGLAGDVDLPERSFDVVVLCHVLEHIPTEARDRFLSALCNKSRGQVLIVGPLAVSAYDGLGDRLAYEITKAAWAAEHIACQLPTRESVKTFAERAGIPVAIAPNGDAAAVFWIVFASYFARRSGEEEALDRITRFFNTHLSEKMTNPAQPNDFIVELAVGRAPLREGETRKNL